MTIQEKAKAALVARNEGDVRWFFMIAMLSAVTGASDAECEGRIEELAK